MKLDLLKKLVKLANHNPNEHEANMAARRACKMLEESKFDLTPDHIRVKPSKPYEDTYEAERAYDERINKMYDDLLNREPK